MRHLADSGEINRLKQQLAELEKKLDRALKSGFVWWEKVHRVLHFVRQHGLPRLRSNT